MPRRSRRIDRSPHPQATEAIDWGAKLAGDLSLPAPISRSRRTGAAFPTPSSTGRWTCPYSTTTPGAIVRGVRFGRRDFDDMARDAAASDDPMLVNYICSRTLPRRGIAAEPGEILVTVGAQNALWLTIQLLAKNGLHAVCENPGYPDIATAPALERRPGHAGRRGPGWPARRTTSA